MLQVHLVSGLGPQQPMHTVLSLEAERIKRLYRGAPTANADVGGQMDGRVNRLTDRWMRRMRGKFNVWVEGGCNNMERIFRPYDYKNEHEPVNLSSATPFLRRAHLSDLLISLATCCFRQRYGSVIEFVIPRKWRDVFRPSKGLYAKWRRQVLSRWIWGSVHLMTFQVSNMYSWIPL